MNRIALLLIGSALASSAFAQKTSLVGGTVINPADGKTIENAVVVINGDKIETLPAARAVSRLDLNGSNATKNLFFPATSTRMCTFPVGRFVHTARMGRISTACGPYKDEVAWIKSHLTDTFARYLRCGITSVVDVGGPMWNFEVRKIANSTAKAPARRA